MLNAKLKIKNYLKEKILIFILILFCLESGRISIWNNLKGPEVIYIVK